jgi:hypothetical protein
VSPHQAVAAVPATPSAQSRKVKWTSKGGGQPLVSDHAKETCHVREPTTTQLSGLSSGITLLWQLATGLSSGRDLLWRGPPFFEWRLRTAPSIGPAALKPDETAIASPLTRPRWDATHELLMIRKIAVKAVDWHDWQRAWWTRRNAKPNQVESSQAKPSQAKPSQAKPSQAKSSQVKSIQADLVDEEERAEEGGRGGGAREQRRGRVEGGEGGDGDAEEGGGAEALGKEREEQKVGGGEEEARRRKQSAHLPMEAGTRAGEAPTCPWRQGPGLVRRWAQGTGTEFLVCGGAAWVAKSESARQGPPTVRRTSRGGGADG